MLSARGLAPFARDGQWQAQFGGVQLVPEEFQGNRNTNKKKSAAGPETAIYRSTWYLASKAADWWGRFPGILGEGFELVGPNRA
jgi:hypothetical protein